MEKETHTHTNFIKVNYYYRSISCNEKAFLEFHGEELSHRFANDSVLSSNAKEETGVFQINWIKFSWVLPSWMSHMVKQVLITMITVPSTDNSGPGVEQIPAYIRNMWRKWLEALLFS